jgi:hypothetical protein
MEYKQISNTLSDLNNTNKLHKFTDKCFKKNINTNIDNFTNLINGILQTFTLKGINLITEYNNINLDKKSTIYNFENIFNIVDGLNSQSHTSFLNGLLDKNYKPDCSSNVKYTHEEITNINKIEDWYIIDINKQNKTKLYEKVLFEELMDTEYKQLQLVFEDNSSIQWCLNILPNTYTYTQATQHNSQAMEQTSEHTLNINHHNIKIICSINYKLSTKTNIITKQTENIITVLKKIDGVLNYL